MDTNDPLFPKQYDPQSSPEEDQPVEQVSGSSPVPEVKLRAYRPVKTKHLQLYCTRSEYAGRKYGMLTTTDKYLLQTFRHSFEHEAPASESTTLNLVCPRCGDDLEFRVIAFKRAVKELGGEAARDRLLGWVLFAVSIILLAFAIPAIRGSGGWKVLLALPGGVLFIVGLLMILLSGPQTDWDALRFWQLHYELRKSRRGDHQHLIGPADPPLF